MKFSPFLNLITIQPDVDRKLMREYLSFLKEKLLGGGRRDKLRVWD